MNSQPLISICDPDERAAIDVVKRFAQRDVAAVAQRYEHDNVYPTELVQKARELGLFGLLVPHAYGGAGVSYKALALVFEELSRVWMGFAGISATDTMMSGVIAAFGTNEQQREYLPLLASGAMIGGTAITEPHAGSDVQAIRTTATAVEGGYRLNGTKTFLTQRCERQPLPYRRQNRSGRGPALSRDQPIPGQKERHVLSGWAVDKLG